MTAPTSNPATKFIDPKALMNIRNLELRARAVVEGFWSGIHRSPYHGFSVEFTEYRQYTPGDDPRYVDWRVFGRSDRFYIKKFEDETNLRCHLIVDQSRSMDFASAGVTKAQYAATLSATLAWFLHQQGDAIGLLSFDAGVREYLPARHRPGHLRHLMLALEKPAGGTATDLVTPLKRVAEIVRKRGLMVLVSDFLAPLNDLDRCLTTLAAGGHELTVFQVLDPAELNFGFDQPTLFEDLESGRTLFIDPQAARAGYTQKLEAHCRAVRELCQKLGATFHRLGTDQPLELALFDFLQERTQRRHVARARNGGSR